MRYKCITVMLRLYQSDEEIPILNFPSFALNSKWIEHLKNASVKVQHKGGETSVKFLRHTCGIYIFDMLYVHFLRKKESISYKDDIYIYITRINTI